MKSIKAVPILKIFIPFLLGLITALQFDIPLGLNTLYVSIGLLLFTHFIDIQYRWYKTVAIYCIFLISGLYVVNFHRTNLLTNHYIHKISKENTVIGTIKSFPKEQNKTSFILKVNFLQNDRFKDKVQGKLLVHLETNHELLQYGDLIQIKGKIKSISTPKNPHSFNYQSYMATQGILSEIYVSSKDWFVLEKGNTSFLSITYSLRSNFKKILEKYLVTPNERSVGLALILGYKSDLSKETKSKYAVTGSMHILAVSGLHVGLIFILLQFLFQNFTSKKKIAIAFKLAIQLLGIWIFVFITGASISVIRAGIMFSFIVLGKSISLKTNTYNSILASAMVILIFSPTQLYTVGFQLSYLAVISIIWLHPKIKKLLIFKYQLANYLWELTAISIAAQILVLPLGIYYFHQFPIYFWLSSWFVIPLATLILYTGIILFIISYLAPILAPILGYILYTAIWMLNSMVDLIEKLPYNHIGDIWIEKFDLLLIYLVIIIGTKALLNKKLEWMTISLSIFSILIISQIFQQYNNTTQNNFTIYHVPNQTIIDHHIGHNNFSISNLPTNKAVYATKGNRLATPTHLLEESIDTIVQTNNRLHYKNFIQIKDAAYYILQKNKSINLENEIIPNKLIVTNNTIFDIKKITQIKDSTLIILDSSNHPNQNYAWELICQLNGIKSYNVTRLGAFVQPH